MAFQWAFSKTHTVARRSSFCDNIAGIGGEGGEGGLENPSTFGPTSGLLCSHAPGWFLKRFRTLLHNPRINIFMRQWGLPKYTPDISGSAKIPGKPRKTGYAPLLHDTRSRNTVYVDPGRAWGPGPSWNWLTLPGRHTWRLGAVSLGGNASWKESGDKPKPESCDYWAAVCGLKNSRTNKGESEASALFYRFRLMGVSPRSNTRCGPSHFKHQLVAARFTKDGGGT